VAVRAEVVEGWLRIVVADEGVGVAERVRETLFEPFVSGRPEGTGLGLAIAREMLEAMGGRIALTRAAPGAEFTLEVPCRPF